MSIFIKEAIVFAIEKEQEAADFYTGLAQKTNRSELKKELLKFADMEMKHKRKLQNMDFENININPPKEDLKIADYMATKEYTEDLSYEDLIAVAMERELMAQRLYEDLAKIAIDPKVKEIFEQLSKEEANHKHYFEVIWDTEVLKEN